MNAQNFDSMWKIMRESSFEINDNISSEYLCIICKRILIDACYGPCGCRYCKYCITDYLKCERRVCPGISEYCKDELINIDYDIHVDQATNTRISRLIVKCPNMSCQIKVDLKSMENHLETCERAVFCPFKNIGCEEDKLQNDKVNEHLSSEVHSHSKLLMEWVNISRNEIELLKKDMGQLRSENYDLKVKVERTEKAERENKIEIEKLGEEMSYLKNENRSLKGELRSLQNQITDQIPNSELRTKVESHNREIDQLKHQFEEKIEIQQRRNHDLEIKLYEISQTCVALKTVSEKTIQSIENTHEFVERSNHGEFIWKIENWSERRRQAQIGIDTAIFSDEFYLFKNGYKMCLCVCPDGFDIGKGAYLSLCFCILKGPFDDILQWPFKHDVEFSLVDQRSGLPHLTYTAKHANNPYSMAFIKPVNERNIGYGNPQFIKLEEISTNPALSQNEKVFIKCAMVDVEISKGNPQIQTMIDLSMN